MTNEELFATIKAEIERRKGICTTQIKANPGQSFPFIMEMTGYDKLLSFLSTLEKECGDFPTTDEEMAKFLTTHPKVEVPEKYKTPDWLYKELEQEPEITNDLDGGGVKAVRLTDGRYVTEKLARELEEEIQGERKKLIEAFGPMNGEQVLAIKDFARHVYELGKQSGYSEIPNELEEAAVEWSKENTRGFVLRDSEDLS